VYAIQYWTYSIVLSFCVSICLCFCALHWPGSFSTVNSLLGVAKRGWGQDGGADSSALRVGC